jgi:2-dehydro-3-deoxy-L-rhamnonate dehydrogenase (NAD+)
MVCHLLASSHPATPQPQVQPEYGARQNYRPLPGKFLGPRRLSHCKGARTCLASVDAEPWIGSVRDEAIAWARDIGMSAFFQLTGQVALVTGGGQGIGAAIACRLHEAGARAAIFDANPQTAREVARALDGIAINGDVTAEHDVARAVAQAEEQLGPLTILVNNAGITGRTDVSWNLGVAEFRQVLDVNVVGPFLFCKAVIPGMLARGYGRILNVASIAGKEGNPTLMPYSASKAAVIALTKSLAKEVAGKGDITVNAIAPAVIRTPILEGISQSTIDYMVSKIPMCRTGTVEEVAALVHYLVSREASFCTGQCYDISGGRATY